MPLVTEQAGAQRTEGGTDTDEQDAGGGQGTQDTGEGRAEQTGGDDGSSSSSSSGASRQDSAQQETEQQETEQHDRAPQGDRGQGHAGQEHGAQMPQGSTPQGRAQRDPVDVGELVWRIARILASAVRVVAYVIAVVLVAYVVLTIVGVNPLNGVAQVIGGVADATVLAFRDLFVVADPTLAVVVNYGLAAVFWVLVAEFGSRLIRFLGARLS